MKVTVINVIEQKINKANLIKWVRKVCNELRKRNIQPWQLEKNLTLAFVNEKEIQNLNQKFRKKDSVTDILSFSSVEEGSLGELALCLSVICRTKTSEFSNEEWLYYLVLHGILHLLGFEHESGKTEAQKMYQLQDVVFEQLIGKQAH